MQNTFHILNLSYFFSFKRISTKHLYKMTCLKCYVNTYKICESPTNTLATDTSFPVESTLTLPFAHTTYTTEAMSSTVYLSMSMYKSLFYMIKYKLFLGVYTLCCRLVRELHAILIYSMLQTITQYMYITYQGLISLYLFIFAP